jgi:hypothetical protein
MNTADRTDTVLAAINEMESLLDDLALKGAPSKSVLYDAIEILQALNKLKDKV